MDENEARDYLAFHLRWDMEPALDEVEKLRLLEYARAVDANGLSPGGAGYVTTYTDLSVDRAVLLGGQWKRSAAAVLHEDNSQEIFEHWDRFVREWAGKVEGIAIGGTSTGSGSFAVANIPVW